MDVDEGTGEGVEGGEGEAAEVGFAGDTALGNLFAEASSGHTPLDDAPTPDEPEEGEEKEETPAEPADTTEADARYQSLNDKLIELQTQNNILRFQQQQRETQTPRQGEQGDEEFSLEKFREKVAKDPTSAIFELFEKGKKAGAAVSEQAIAKARDEAVAVMERQEAFKSDQTSVVAEYGELLKDNKQFAALAETIYAQMTANSPETSPGRRWHKGAMYAATSIAFAQMVKAGALNANPKVVQMRERKSRPSNPLVGDTRADKPRTIASDIPPHELAVMKKTAQRMGLKGGLDEYLKIFGEMQKRDKSYGS